MAQGAKARPHEQEVKLMSRLRGTCAMAVVLLALTGAPLAAEAGDSGGEAPPGLTLEQQATLTEYAAAPVVTVTQASRLPSRFHTADATTTRKIVKAKRGGRLLWTEDVVEFGYTGKGLTSSTAYARCGAFFPNRCWNLSQKRVVSTGKVHQYRFLDRIGAGVVTPLGEVNLYTQDHTTYITVEADGDTNVDW